MRILITQRELIHRAGSELFTIEVATELGKRGHEVAVFCPRLGQLANIMFAAGVWIKPRLAEIPWVPEIIHGQHHLQTMAALAYFPKAPAVYHCHGYFPWVEQVPLHPRIRTYVMTCRWMVGCSSRSLEFRETALRCCRISSTPNGFRRYEARRIGCDARSCSAMAACR